VKVFISWSGEPEPLDCRALDTWLESVVQHVDTWTSDEEIRSGQRWSDAIAIPDTSAHLTELDQLRWLGQPVRQLAHGLGNVAPPACARSTPPQRGSHAQVVIRVKGTTPCPAVDSWLSRPLSLRASTITVAGE
jgi:hypothetical protein